MKTKVLYVRLIILTGVILIFQDSFAQKEKCKSGQNYTGPKKSCCIFSIPGLTEEQKEKIAQLQIIHFKEVKNLKNELNEKEAKQQTLITAEKVNMDEINKNIDEITGLQNKLMKACISFRQSVRQLLTEEQKINYDMQLVKKGKCGHNWGHMKPDDD